MIEGDGGKNKERGDRKTFWSLPRGYHGRWICVSPAASWPQGPSSYFFFFFFAMPNGMRILVPPLGIKPAPPALEAQRLNH